MALAGSGANVGSNTAKIEQKGARVWQLVWQFNTANTGK
jgi:hypothetical protein